MLSRVVFKKQRGRRPLTALAILSLATGMIVSSGAVLAVHDEQFQLDGNVLAASTTSYGSTGTPPVAKTQLLDWNSIFTGVGANGEGVPATTLPTGFSDPGFKQDFRHSTATGGNFITTDTSTFATGSKDTLPIADWQCNFDNNVNSKIDIMNAYAVSYENAAGDEIMYFALERNTNTGDANVGFWFLQSEASCNSPAGSTDWVGAHADGDVLVVSEFSGGGDVSTINVYRWDGDDATGSLNTTPIGDGVDCRAALTLPGDSACAAANRAAITTPWLTANFKDKVGDDLRTSEFFEGAINLTDLQLGGQCLNTFIADTRSSTSLTATLFDFASDSLGGCESTTVTTPKYDNGTAYVDIPAPGISIGTNARVNVRDSAYLTVDGVEAYTGDVTFSLCGPLSLTSTSNCQTGGVQIGDPVEVVGTGPETVLGPVATLTSAGRYCWRAEYSGDSIAGVPPSSDPKAPPAIDTTVTECFKVNPVQPTLSTQASGPTVDFGQVISDKVFLSGTAKQPGTDGAGPGGTINATAGTQAAAGGTISVTAYGPGCGTIALPTVSLTVSGDKTGSLFYGGPGSATEFLPAAPGLYTFVASYGGNDPNTLAAPDPAIACANQPSAEQVTVRTIPTQISTAPSYFPQDSATITSSIATDNLPANGTVTFRLYGATTGPSATALANCQAAGSTGLVYAPAGISTGAAANSVTVGTNNTTFRVSASGTYYWLVTYAPGDTAHTGSQSNCQENIAATLTGDAGPGTLFPTPVTP